MRAKKVNEDVSAILAPKEHTEIIREVLWDYENYSQLRRFIYEILDKLNEKGISVDKHQEQIRKILMEVFDNSLDEVYDFASMGDTTNESIKDTLKPKKKEDIISTLREAGWDEIILKDGKTLWLIEEDIPGMAGETMTIYSLVDENGNKYPLNNKILDEFPFEMNDRIELVQLMDDAAQTNYNNAIAYVK